MPPISTTSSTSNNRLRLRKWQPEKVNMNEEKKRVKFNLINIYYWELVMTELLSWVLTNHSHWKRISKSIISCCAIIRLDRITEVIGSNEEMEVVFSQMLLLFWSILEYFAPYIHTQKHLHNKNYIHQVLYIRRTWEDKNADQSLN